MMTLAAIFDFVSFRIVDVLDILIVAILLFELYKLTKGTAAVKIFWVLALIYVIWKVVAYFHFTMLSDLMGELALFFSHREVDHFSSFPASTHPHNQWFPLLMFQKTTVSAKQAPL